MHGGLVPDTENRYLVESVSDQKGHYFKKSTRLWGQGESGLGSAQLTCLDQ